MGIWVVLLSSGLFLFVMALYKICQTTFLRQNKSKIEEIGFLSDSLLQFLEFSVLVVTFLLIEGLLLDSTEQAPAKIWFIMLCFALFVLDDILLYKKIKK